MKLETNLKKTKPLEGSEKIKRRKKKQIDEKHGRENKKIMKK